MKRLAPVLLIAAWTISCGDKESTSELRGLSTTVDTLATTWAAVGEYRGLEEVDGILKTRLLADPKGSFTLANYLRTAGIASSGLSALLGQWTGNGLEVEFRSGKPNAVNFVLWHIAITALAQDLARQCPSEAENSEAASTLILSESFKTVLHPICRWPINSERADEALEALWLATMAFDAPRIELDAFKAFAKDEAFVTTPAREATAVLIAAILLNPHFILRK